MTVGRPAEPLARHRGVADQQAGVGRPDEVGVHLDQGLPVGHPGVLEGRGHEVAHAVRPARRDDVVAGHVVPRGAHHRVDVVRGPAPVAAGVEVAQGEPVGPAGGDRGHRAGDLAGDEGGRSARRLVVVEDDRRGEQPARPLDPGDVVGERLGRAVRAHRADGRALVLRGGAPAPRRSRRCDGCSTRTSRPRRSCRRRAASIRVSAATPLTRVVSSGSSQERATELSPPRL